MSVSSLDELIEAYSQVGSANRRSFKALTVVLAQLHECGITCILLKGADLVPRLYGVWGLRPMADVDLLVRECDLPTIDRVLQELGYLPQIDGNPAYRDPDGRLALDLVTKIWYTDDTEGIWRRAIQHDLGGLPVLGMGAEDLLIFLTAYVVLYRGHFSPSFSQNLGLLTSKEPLNWEFILGEAGRRQLRIPLFHGLSYAISREAVVIPPEALARLAPADTREKLLAFLLRRLVCEEALEDMGHFLLLITRPRRKKGRWLREVFYPSTDFLKCRYGLRGHTHPLWTRITRAFYLIARAQSLSAKILYRLVAHNT